eukprot:TRINITY_DN22514_c0_g1_i1.p1 TRINITY_DN22514_c0_g1~~TRINITY_DN22514_c0_g1_i1.p1  ORF type:complete len:293 (-),score=35.11 TRINITY_DN22514_c0_g1_i1:88-966(-)
MEQDQESKVLSVELHPVVVVERWAQKPPEKETIIDMISQILCPTFAWRSVTCLLALLTLAGFVFLVAVCPREDRFLSMTTQCLHSYGAGYAYDVRHHLQLYRILMTTLLSPNFVDFVKSLVLLLVLGTLVESTLRPLRFLLVYVGSAITGGLFALIASDKLVVGNTPALFGLIGAALALLVLRNLALDAIPQTKTRLLFIAFLCIFVVGEQVYTKFFTPKSTPATVEGHIAGAIGGFLLTLALIPPGKRELVSFYGRTLRLTGVTLYVSYLLVEVGLFFLYRQPVDSLLYYA